MIWAADFVILQNQDFDQTEANDLMLFRSQFFQPAGLILRHHQEQQLKFQQQVCDFAHSKLFFQYTVLTQKIVAVSFPTLVFLAIFKI